MRSYKTTTPKFKFSVILAALSENKTDSEIARQHSISPQLVNQWKRQFFKIGHKVFDRETAQKDNRFAELEKIIGQQTIEIQFLKKVLNHQD